MTSPAASTSRDSPAATAGRLRLRADGEFVNNAGTAVKLEPKDALLLAYLAVEGPTPRGRLASLLWPDVDDERARGNLRQRLLRLKRATHVELVVGNPLARLAPGIGHDLDDAHPLLGMIDEEQAGGFAEWLRAQRERRRRGRRQWLAAAAAQAEAAGELDAALDHAHALLDLEPLSEDAHRRVMRLHYLRGDTAAALAAYERCRNALERELGTAPSRETEALLADLDRARSGSTLPVRGGAVPLPILRPPRLVGRDAEWAALLAAWHAGQPAIVLGEAGLGKTRLVTDFARARGGVIVISARPGDEGVVYAVAARLLRRLPREVLAALDGALRAELARLLPELGEAAPIASEAALARFFNAVAAALAAAAPGVSGVVVEDLHFADEASVELMRYLVGDGAMRWLFTARDAEAGGAARALIDGLARTQAARIELAPLALPQLVELVDSLAIDGLAGERLAPALLAHTGGNPLFVLETLKAWLMQGNPGTSPRLPALPNVGALIERRIGRLSPEAVRLARCAAVAGQDFSTELAAHVLGVRTLDLADAWAELEAAQVFRDSAFAHDLIYESALASVPPPIARQLHREIAAFLASRDGEPARVAEHWHAAGQWAPAAAALLRAAERARAACRWREAAAQLAEAAACFERAGDGAGRFEALLARSQVLVYCDLGEEALACARAAQQAAVDPDQQVRAAIALTQILVHRGDIAEALAAGNAGIAAARARGDRLAESRLAVAMSGCLCDLQRPHEALALLEPLRGWMEANGTPADRCELLIALGLALDQCSRLAEARRALEAACELAREAGLTELLSEASSNLASTLAKTGRVRRAAELGAQAVALMRTEAGLTGRPLQSQLMLAHRLRDLGRYTEALPLFEEALAGFRAAGSRFWIAAAEHRLALAWIQLGQYARAQRLLAQPPAVEVPRAQAMWLAARAELARLAAGSAGEAVASIRQAMALLASDTENGSYRIVTLFATAIVPPDEGEALATALAAWANARERFGMALAAHVRAARCALAQNAAARAAPHVEAALRLAPEYEMDSMYRGELWWVAHRTFAACGDAPSARRALDEGCDWVHAVARQHVPPQFRDSFLHRNPVNRELLTLRSRAARGNGAA
jgi:DNA-binding SARP family transcriptional activator/tetratricopeptide (TPR) repeat protein